jgi:hypothetical protein
MSGRGLILILGMVPALAWAYPQYAVRYGIPRCTACHYSPAGGGPRNVSGKLFGAHDFKINPFLVQDYVSADFRTLAYYPQRAGSAKGGMGVMSGSIAGHIGLDAKGEFNLVIEHNIAGFAQAPWRDTYALIDLQSGGDRPRWFDSILIGRFRPPFGIVSDEHRTYTRIQSATEWYTFETGAMLSGTPSSSWHYDLALVNSETSSGQSLSTQAAERWGGFANVRYMPGAAWFGVSESYHDHSPARESRRALSIYSVLSLSRWTKNRIPVSVRLEHVEAKNWGSHLGQGFASDSNYVQSLSTSQSQGWLAWFEYEISDRLWLVYKYDRLTPDRDFPADYYERHGVGFRWALAANVLLQVRSEFARATPPSEAHSTTEGGQDASFAILRLGF